MARATRPETAMDTRPPLVANEAAPFEPVLAASSPLEVAEAESDPEPELVDDAAESVLDSTADVSETVTVEVPASTVK